MWEVSDGLQCMVRQLLEGEQASDSCEIGRPTYPYQAQVGMSDLDFLR